jgi:hypothetical protein
VPSTPHNLLPLFTKNETQRTKSEAEMYLFDANLHKWCLPQAAPTCAINFIPVAALHPTLMLQVKPPTPTNTRTPGLTDSFFFILKKPITVTVLCQ